MIKECHNKGLYIKLNLVGEKMSKVYTNTETKKDCLLNRLLDVRVNNNLLICSPFFTHNDYLDYIIDNNIKLNLVVRLCTSTDCQLLMSLLDKPNIQVRFFNSRVFHSKMYVIDSKTVILGSSNFTKSGLNENMELNVELDNNFEGFNELLRISVSYWNQAQVLTCEVLNKLSELLEENRSNKDETELEKRIAGINSNIKKKRVFSEIHKKRISESNKGKKGAKLEGERLRKLNDAAILSLSKPVVCINTGKKYDSMQIASREVYGYDRGYGYISKVCKGEREHYKKLVWRYYEEYKDYSDVEKEKLKELIRRINTKQYTEKLKRKILCKSMRYDSLKEFGEYALQSGLIKAGSSRPEQIISALIKSSEKQGIPFARLSTKYGFEYFYYADYDVIMDKDKVVEEKPVKKSLEEYMKEYDELLDLELGDLTLGDLLCSNTKKFYKINDKYYKSKTKLMEDYTYDEIIDRERLLVLIKEKGYSANWQFDIEKVNLSQKNKYYLKDNIIYQYKNDFIKLNCTEVNKEAIMCELELSLKLDFTLNNIY